jgi:hypothetical protein
VCNTRPVKRWLGLALLLLTAALAAAVVYTALQRRALSERAAAWIAEGMGVGPVSLEVTALGVYGVQIRNLSVGEPPDLSIERLSAVWVPEELTRMQLARLELEGMHLHARITDEGALSFGALDPALEGESTTPYPREVTLSDATIELATPQGTVSLEGVEGTIVPDVARLATGELQVAALRDHDVPARFPPVRLEIRAGPEGDKSLAIELEAETAEGRANVSGVGSLDPESMTGDLELSIGRLVLDPDGLRLGDLAPTFAAELPEMRGAISGTINARFGSDQTSPYSVTGEIQLDDLSLRREGTRLRGLDGRIRFAGPDPWRTAGEQQLHFSLLDLVGALRDGSVRFEATETRVDLASFECSWAGGRIETGGHFDLMNSEGGLAVELGDLDLSLVLKELAIADLTGTGRLSGVVALVLEGDSLRVSASFTASPDGGVIRYQPAAGAAARLGLSGDIAQVADALEDYHYEKLMFGLEGDLAGDVRMRVHLEGRNPAYEGGRPVHMNLTIEANVPATLLASRAASRMPEVLERKLRDRVRAR